MSNAPARQMSLQIPRYMRVPSRSVLAKVFKGETDLANAYEEVEENLVWWTSSDGGALAPLQVRIQAMKVRDRIFAIVSLAE